MEGSGFDWTYRVALCHDDVKCLLPIREHACQLSARTELGVERIWNTRNNHGKGVER